MSSHGWLTLDQLLYNHLKKIPVGATKSSMRYLGDQVFEQKKNWSGVNQHKLAKSVKGGVFDRKWFIEMYQNGQVTGRLWERLKKKLAGAKTARLEVNWKFLGQDVGLILDLNWAIFSFRSQ